MKCWAVIFVLLLSALSELDAGPPEEGTELEVKSQVEVTLLEGRAVVGTIELAPGRLIKVLRVDERGVVATSGSMLVRISIEAMASLQPRSAIPQPSSPSRTTPKAILPRNSSTKTPLSAKTIATDAAIRPITRAAFSRVNEVNSQFGYMGLRIGMSASGMLALPLAKEQGVRIKQNKTEKYIDVELERDHARGDTFDRLTKGRFVSDTMKRYFVHYSGGNAGAHADLFKRILGELGISGVSGLREGYNRAWVVVRAKETPLILVITMDPDFTSLICFDLDEVLVELNSTLLPLIYEKIESMPNSIEMKDRVLDHYEKGGRFALKESYGDLQESLDVLGDKTRSLTGFAGFMLASEILLHRLTEKYPPANPSEISKGPEFPFDPRFGRPFYASSFHWVTVNGLSVTLTGTLEFSFGFVSAVRL